MAKESRRSLWPDDLVEYSPKPVPFDWINTFHKPDAALQMFAEAWMVFTILGRGSETGAVGLAG